MSKFLEDNCQRGTDGLYIPIQHNGSMLKFYTKNDNDLINWNYTFVTDLYVINIKDRAYSPHVSLLDNCNNEFYMFSFDFVDMLQKTTLTNGWVTGTWRFTHKWRFYGIVYV